MEHVQEPVDLWRQNFGTGVMGDVQEPVYLWRQNFGTRVMGDVQEPVYLWRQNFGTRVMGDVQEPLKFRELWSDQVKAMLYNGKALENALPRVARPLLSANPEAYIPQFLSLGPYHHSRLEKDGTYQYRGLKMSAAEAYKVISAAAISQRTRCRSFEELVRRIEEILPDVVKLYDLQIKMDCDLSKNFSLMMAVDASFLLIFLFDRLGSKLTEIDFSQLQVCIKCDILKLENQIPLTVLKLVYDNVREASLSDRSIPRGPFKNLLLEAYKQLSPFDINFDLDDLSQQNLVDLDNSLEGQPHILGCIHGLVSPFLQTGRSQNPTLLQKICSCIDKYLVVKICGIFFCFSNHPDDIDRLIKGYSAGQLARAGVKFKSFSKLSDKIRFEEGSHTLYLPPLTVISYMQTEVFFRNLVALEFNDTRRPNAVTRYVGLMDCLIDKTDDVRVLMDSHVIRRGSLMLTDERIAKMWDGMCQPFFTGHLEPPEELKQAFQNEVRKKYYKVKIKVRLAETWQHIYLKFFSRPWKFLAFLFAFFLLVLNFIQAFCSWFKCRSSN